MTYFVIHDASGGIRRWGECPAADVAAQAEAGETALALASLPDGDLATSYRVEDGALVGFSATTPPPTEADLRAYAKRLRKEREAEGTQVTLADGRVIDIDTEGDDVSKLTALFVQASNGMIAPPIGFKGGGSFHELTLAELNDVAAAASAHVIGAYATEAAAHAAIAAETATELADIDAIFA